MTDLERARKRGITLARLRSERRNAVREMVDPAMAAFRRATLKALQERQK